MLGSGVNACVIPATAIRCETSLMSVRSALQRAVELCEAGQSDELLAAEMRVALHDLGLVSGAVSTDDILDRVFSRFCIGK